MVRLFISQPMQDKTKEEIKEERERIIQTVKERYPDVVVINSYFDRYPDVVVINSYFDDYNPDCGCVPLKYLGKSLELLSTADIVYFAEGWKNYRGCRIEHTCAMEYGIKII